MLYREKHVILHNILNKYALIIYRILGTWKTKPVGIELQPGAK